MPKIETAHEAREEIRRAVEAVGRDSVLDSVVMWNNTTDNDIDEAGNVWVANPQTGHWLDEDKLISFANFLSDT